MRTYSVRAALLVCAAALPSLASAQLPYGIDAPSAVGPYLDGVFPSEAPGAADTYEAVAAYPALRFQDPLVYTPVPGQDRVALATRQGVIWSFVDDPNTAAKEVFLDLTDRCAVVWDGGFLGLAFHPEFGVPGSPNAEYVYAFYCHSSTGTYPTTYGSSNGFFDCYLRLSRFTVPGASAGGVLPPADPASEQIMMQMRLYNGSHRAGHIAFGPDGFLYVPIGDQFRYTTAQDIENNLEGGIHRIDVDRDPARSHAPRRTLPLGLSDEWSGVGYWIPNDNPFVDASGSRFEEYWSLGHRNHHRMAFDPVTGELWVGEVGGGLREEINVVVRGGNYGWPFREGFSPGPRAEPATYWGTLVDPAVDFLRSESNAIIGGYVYRGARLPGLYGKYLCAGYAQDRIFAVERDPATGAYSKSVVGHFDPEGAITFGQDPSGELYIGRQNGDTTLYTLEGIAPSAEPPALLSSLGVFTDLANLTPRPGLVPYDLNEPFWSDGAAKARWIAVPNDGAHDTAAERIVPDLRGGNWSFPAGTVLVKHFELDLDETQPGARRRLETRFVVFTADDFYTVSYKWLPDGSDAVLQTERSEEVLDVVTDAGPRPQTWTFPGRQDCRVCHGAATGGALGLRTHQLHRDLVYPSGVVDDQLRTWAHLGIFGSALTEADVPSLPRAAYHGDLGADLDLRARSWLDANCAHCHRADAATRAIFDARFETPLYATDLLGGGVADDLGVDGAEVVAPREVLRSIALHRAAAVGPTAMPPLAKDRVDEGGTAVFADWIRNLDPSAHLGLGNESVPSSSIDGWASNLVVNESDTYTNDTGGPVELRIEAFRFFAERTGAPITPFVVRVFGNDDFRVAAVGTTRESGEYRPGRNAFPFADGGAPRIALAPGETVATGFIDARADGSGSGGGSVVPFCVCNDGDELWYSGGPSGGDAGSVAAGAAPSTGTNLLLNLTRAYSYSIDFALELPNAGPALSEPADLVAPLGGYVEGTLEAADTDGDILVFSADGLPAGIEIDPATGRIAGWLGATPAGTYPIAATVDDGRLSDTRSFDLVVGPASVEVLYTSFMSGVLLPGGVQVWDEDIARLDVASGVWTKFFDGSDVGVREDVRGFHVLASGDLLFSFNQSVDLPGLVGGPNGETVDPQDVVRFVPTTLGPNTTGTWHFHVDGSDVFESADASSKIDALTALPDGRLVVSTRGTCRIAGRTFRDEDLIALEGTFGADTNAVGRKVFDGSLVGLGQSEEDVDAAALDPAGRLLLSVYVPSATESGAPLDVGDVATFAGSLGWQSSGTIAGLLRAIDLGFPGANVSALHVEGAAAATAPAGKRAREGALR